MSRDIKPDSKKLSVELKKLRAVCIFTGGAAHDYNNALTAVMGNISLSKLEAGENQELIELLEDAEKASVRIKMMTERLALFARAIRINKKKSNVAEIIQDVLTSVISSYPGSIKLDVVDDAVDVDVDPELISEALICILENACEAAPSSEGIIEVSVSREDVRNSSVQYGDGAADGDYIKVSVKDNGSGFNPADSNVIFDPYFSTKAGRDGIGLALANSILKRHRGFLAASLPQNGGSLFSVFIPLF